MSNPSSPVQPGSCVLIVEASAESREVFRTVLARRGLLTIETDDAQQGLLLAEQHQPGVIVFDLETARDDRQSVCNQYAASSRRGGASLVMLGAVARRTHSGAEQMVAKPYHYGPLIRTIEQLARRAMLAARGESSAKPNR